MENSWKLYGMEDVQIPLGDTLKDDYLAPAVPPTPSIPPSSSDNESQASPSPKNSSKRRRRGLGGMSPERRREIAKKGNKRLRELGKINKFQPKEDKTNA
jgi:hypothetical protein